MLSNAQFTWFGREIGIWDQKEVRDITGDRVGTSSNGVRFQLQSLLPPFLPLALLPPGFYKARNKPRHQATHHQHKKDSPNITPSHSHSSSPVLFILLIDPSHLTSQSQDGISPILRQLPKSHLYQQL